jgi:hypothetical protein
MSFAYTYTVGADKWGRWFQRWIRFPTADLTIVLDFPAQLNAWVWGRENKLGRDWQVVASLPRKSRERDRTLWTWSTVEPRVGDRYRLEWRFRNSDSDQES